MVAKSRRRAQNGNYELPRGPAMSSAAAPVSPPPPASGPQPRAVHASNPPAAPTAPAPVALQPTPKRRPGRSVVIATGLVLVLGAGGAWYASRRGHESTDDAQIDAEVVAIPARAGGVVAKLYFNENQRVKAG